MQIFAACKAEDASAHKAKFGLNWFKHFLIKIMFQSPVPAGHGHLSAMCLSSFACSCTDQHSQQVEKKTTMPAVMRLPKQDLTFLKSWTVRLVRRHEMQHDWRMFCVETFCSGSYEASVRILGGDAKLLSTDP